ncbi:MAG: cupin domain-containing protein [Chloroflexi bacterium]|nr:cupin domain-containing protein [Chloroflexota bacterium]
MAVQDKLGAEDLKQYYNAADGIRLSPGWLGGEEEASPELAPYLWRWSEVEPLVLKSGEVVTPDRDVERRTMRLATPGLKRGTTHTLIAALQLLLPGECAPAHRHTPTAIRWILKGHGAYTTVQGDKCYMEPGDLILTPSWTWHDHTNEGTEPMIWLDGLDVPLVRYLKANFYEPFPEDQQPVTGVGDSVRKYASGSLKPTWGEADAPYSPLWHYKWDRTYDALTNLAELDSDPFDDVSMEYTDPSTGGPVLRTMTCRIQLIRPGIQTKAHRHTSSKIYQVFRGSGYTVIDGQRFDWTEGDFFIVPSWAWHEHASTSDGEAILFSIQDIPIMKSMALYREEPYTEHAGHQPVTSQFNTGS